MGMLCRDCLTLIGLGGLFLALGLTTLIWGKREEKDYFNSLSARPGDTREFMEHWPPRPQPSALKLGGWLAVTIGLVMLTIGGVLWLMR
ncbi:MAG: hypothetical protein QGI95_04935 [Dehalococcoidales bacterium]|nr:hypothetical protein [Dehalococcoidales bacterium]MDP6825451.1 hypothetical protein [Dehalococcoidales bacterium]|tara:strand:+ start:1540 stop:1806 length:267 start_codon:yes stop_codon:yes gene_type:complete